MVFFSGLSDDQEYDLRNPVLNSPKDITDDLIQRIIDNNLDSLTINYEFACYYDEWKNNHWECENKLKSLNPFWMANMKKPLKSIDFKVFLGRNVHSLGCAFMYCSELEYVNLIDTSNITCMFAMFAFAEAFNQPIGDWDVSNVTDMCIMFARAVSFNQPIGAWNVSNVMNMGGMFYRASSFNQPIGNWDVSNVTNMEEMFGQAISFNQAIGDWDISNVFNERDMFKGANSFRQELRCWKRKCPNNWREVLGINK